LLRADYAWQDKIQFNVINDFNNQSAYGTANARIALASRAQTWAAVPAARRTAGIEGTYRWNPAR
jgi:hypothetical protein